MRKTRAKTRAKTIDSQSYKYSTAIINSIVRKGWLCKCTESRRVGRNLVMIKNWLYQRTDLTDADRELIIIRYGNVLEKVWRLYNTSSMMYTSGSLFTSITSLLLTGIIAVNNINDSNASAIMWWVSGGMSLSVSIVNTVSTFYKWDRKYLLLFQIYTKLEQEVWMFLELVGPYAYVNNHGDHSLRPAVHVEKLKVFLAKVELLHKRLNENLLDIEENDQDDKDALRNRTPIHGTSNHGTPIRGTSNHSSTSGNTDTSTGKLDESEISEDDQFDDIDTLVVDIADKDVHNLLHITKSVSDVSTNSKCTNTGTEIDCDFEKS